MILRDPSLSPEERSQRFNAYISGYYTHKDLKSRKLEDLHCTLVTGPEGRPSSIPAMTQKELAELTTYEAVTRSEVAVRSAAPDVYQSFVRRAFLEPRQLKSFPKCGVDVVWCENSTWEIVYATWTLEKLVEDADERNEEHRRLRTFMIPGPSANHFVSNIA